MVWVNVNKVDFKARNTGVWHDCQTKYEQCWLHVDVSDGMMDSVKNLFCELPSTAGFKILPKQIINSILFVHFTLHVMFDQLAIKTSLRYTLCSRWTTLDIPGNRLPKSPLLFFPHNSLSCSSTNQTPGIGNGWTAPSASSVRLASQQFLSSTHSFSLLGTDH